MQPHEVGSNPTSAYFALLVQLVEHTAVNRDVLGSSPRGSVNRG